jgi:hypothetical protein
MTSRLLVLALTLGACRSTRYPQLPRHLQGPFAARVHSALRPHPALHCHDRIITLGLGMQAATGCYFYSNDSSLFYFYFEESGDVLAWGHSWHVPDSTREQALRALKLEENLRFGVEQACPPLDSEGNYNVWRTSEYFVYAVGDSSAAKRNAPYNLYEGAKIGSPTCTSTDAVYPPFGQ